MDPKILPGSADILLIAPHGLPEDDENTDRIARQVAGRLACAAIINDELPRKKLDFNIITEAERHPIFIQAIKRTIARTSLTRVIWVHGMKDQSAKDEACKTNTGAVIHCLIGCGLPDRLSANPQTVARLTAQLQARGLNTYVAADQASKFRGYSVCNMNQWFRNNGYPLSAVESLQLEFSWSGVRDEGNIARTAAKLAAALKPFTNSDP